VSAASPSGPRIWLDRGGTFTDVIRVDAAGRLSFEKVPSDRASLDELAAGAAESRRGTTVATNALLEAKGAKVALFTTAGFEDLAELRDQTRPGLFQPDRPRPPSLATTVWGLHHRIAVGGEVLLPIDPTEVAAAAQAARAAGMESAAVVLIHGPEAPDEELRVAELLRAAGFSWISLGHEICPGPGFVARLETTLADAATSPLLPRSPGLYLRSDGGLARAEDPGWRGCHAALSGPAGGAVAVEHIARLAGVDAAFGLDMGGTSTDLSRAGPAVDRCEGLRVGGTFLQVPTLRIHTIAAGGGSLLSVRGGIYTVGPGSAGASPGPACYGRGGPATLTDAEAVLGRLPGFPSICGPNRDAPLDLAAAEAALRALDPARDPTDIALGFVAVAHENLARAIRRLAGEVGVDPAAHALLAFGGAGPAHATGLARRLGIRTVIVPFLASGLSALGIGLAQRRATWSVPVRHGDLAAALAAALHQERRPFSGHLQIEVVLRHKGNQDPLPFPLTAEDLALHETSSDLRARLEARFRSHFARQFGLSRPGAPVEFVEVRAALTAGEAVLPDLATTLPEGPGPRRTCAYIAGGWRDVPCLPLAEAHGLRGPALIRGAGFSLPLEPGWSIERGPGFLRLTDHLPGVPALGPAFHPVHTAVFASRVAALAEEMGAVLCRLAASVSIRERKDFSCAVFDARGGLAVNAPHVPVHLGAMGETVRTLIRLHADTLAPGQAWVTNDPNAGGSHLPDITVIQPVFFSGSPEDPPHAFVACRGHHVDVGGLRPGSMAPDARNRAEEGLTIPLQLLAEAGLLAAIPLPGCRQPEVVRSDLAAQVAACAVGSRGLERLLRELGPTTVRAQLDHLQRAAAWSAEARIAEHPGVHLAEEHLDDGTPIRVRLQLAEGNARIEIDGPPHPGSLNAPPAVARAAVLYTFRCLVEEELPLNEGALAPFQICVEPGGLFDPAPTAAVAGGNVETSQRLVDALLRALGHAAASQGTMNNLTVGTPVGTWYETIGGGGGATARAPGLDASQVHMTNTQATDVEILEANFPVRLLTWARRRGSGGHGHHRGGDGTIKEWLFLSEAEVCLLTGRRNVGAPGLAGGGAGAPGRDLIDQGQGWVPAPAVWTARPGDRLRIETPGGGAYGSATPPPPHRHPPPPPKHSQ
jgi:5-oxoprolinase (ATP-hydrolysing)